MWIYRLFYAIGAVSLVVGVVLAVRTAQFVAGAERATGTVIDLKEDYSSSNGHYTYYPIVRFTTADGREIQFTSSSGSSPASESPGDEVEVLYESDDPHDAQISGFFHVWLWPAVMLPLGAMFIIITWSSRHRKLVKALRRRAGL